MNAALPDSHPSIHYYDSDYPGRGEPPFPENFDAVTEVQGVAHDVERYLELADGVDGPLLELGCGTGRVGLALARAGHSLVGVDLSANMLDHFRDRLRGEPARVTERIELVRQDVTALDLPRRDFGLAILPFNSLLCITDQASQLRALECAAEHLRRGGRLAIDAVNPLVLPLGGQPIPRPFFTRRNVHTGNLYTRFAALGPMEADQRQELYGWYDEVAADTRAVLRTAYSMHWRPVFRSELELMVRLAGLETAAVEGGHRGEPFEATSAKLFVLARKP